MFVEVMLLVKLLLHVMKMLTGTRHTNIIIKHEKALHFVVLEMQPDSCPLADLFAYILLYYNFKIF